MVSWLSSIESQRGVIVFRLNATTAVCLDYTELKPQPWIRLMLQQCHNKPSQIVCPNVVNIKQCAAGLHGPLDPGYLLLQQLLFLSFGGLFFLSDCLCDFQTCCQSTWYHRPSHRAAVIFSDVFIILHIEASCISLLAKKALITCSD